MKKNAIKLLLLCTVVTVVFVGKCTAQKIVSSKIPVVVKKTFAASFPGVTAVQWEQEDKNYEAGFKQQGKTMSALIDERGTLLETETAIAITELPAPVTAYIVSHHKSAKISEAAIIKKANGEVVYEAEVNHKDLLFNADGKLIK